MTNTIKTIVILFICFSGFLNTQQKAKLLKDWKNTNNSIEVRFNSGHDLVMSHYLKNKLDSAYIVANKLFTLAEQSVYKADAITLLGLVDYNLSNYEVAFNRFEESFELYKKNGDLDGQVNVLNNIGLLYNNEFRFKSSLNYLNKALKLNTKNKNSTLQIEILANIGFVFNNSFKTDSALVYLNKALKLAKRINEPTEFILSEIGNNYVKRQEYDKALKYYEMSIFECNRNTNKNQEISNLFKISTQYIFQKKFKKSIPFAEKSLALAKEVKDPNFTKGSLLNLYEAYKGLGNESMALYYLEQNNSQSQIVKEVEFNRDLQEFEIREIKLKDSLLNDKQQLKQKLVYEREKTNLTIAWGAVLAGGILIAFITYRKIKRKQRKAEEERQKQIEEKEKILKDLELQTIDAMIAGQEKERERLASDLHDSVGATLSAAKLQFNYLIKDEIDSKVRKELIKKTSTLLEDAYVEIRSMAHLKNSGVMAKNGLLPAVKKLSQNASGINGLSFDVQSFGLEQRLDNALEISIFRIIQELVTNIIKHAQATQGVIHLTNHHETFNIMVEDNGIGFKPNQTTTINAGMGLSSIDKRIAHLEGKLNIESKENKGTTIIIDIPL